MANVVNDWVGSAAAGASYVCLVSSRFSISATDCPYCLSG